MTDIVERLRRFGAVVQGRDPKDYAVPVPAALIIEAADEIERLRDALRDIACDCEDHCDDSPYGHGAITPNCCRNFARSALGRKSDD